MGDRKDYADLDLPPSAGWMKDAVQVLYFFAAVFALAGVMLLIAWFAHGVPS